MSQLNPITPAASQPQDLEADPNLIEFDVTNSTPEGALLPPQTTTMVDLFRDYLNQRLGYYPTKLAWMGNFDYKARNALIDHFLYHIGMPNASIWRDHLIPNDSRPPESAPPELVPDHVIKMIMKEKNLTEAEVRAKFASGDGKWYKEPIPVVVTPDPDAVLRTPPIRPDLMTPPPEVDNK